MNQNAGKSNLNMTILLLAIIALVAPPAATVQAGEFSMLCKPVICISEHETFTDEGPAIHCHVPSVWWGGKKGSFISHSDNALGEAFYYFEQENLKEHYNLRFIKCIRKNGCIYAIYHEVSLDGQTEYTDYKWALPAFSYPHNTGLSAYHKRPRYSWHRHSFVYVTPLPSNFNMAAPARR